MKRAGVALSLLLAAMPAICLAAPAASPAPAAAPTPDDPVPCVPPGADLAHPTPFVVTADQLKDVESAYQSPSVIGLRDAIHGYLAGYGDAETTMSLAHTSRAVVASRFIVLSIDAGIFGGTMLILQFTGHPAEVYRAWVYPLGGKQYVVRRWETTACTPAEQEWSRVRYGALMAQILANPKNP